MASDQSTRFPYPRRHVIRFLTRTLARAVFHTLAEITIDGAENFPRRGPFLVVANHFHYADPAVMLQAVPWQLEFLGGFHMPNAPKIVTWLPKVWGYYQVHRDGSSREAIRAAVAVLNQNGFLGIFPEAGSWASVLRPARPGTAFLATRTGAPLLPVGISGMNDIFPALRRRQRARVVLKVGQPFGPFDVSGSGREKRRQLDEIGHTIMQKIAELLPPEQRGCFSDDPNLRREAEAVAAYPWE